MTDIFKWRLAFVRLAPVIFLIGFLQACSGLDVSQDSGLEVNQDHVQEYNFSSLKTFAWEPDEDNASGVKSNSPIDRRIRTAIENNLLAKSYRLVDSYTPDFFISYHVTVEQETTASDNGRVAQLSAYDKGTLLIDVKIPLGSKVVWRGVGTQPIPEFSSAEESRVRINNAVEKLLARFPPD